MTAEEKDRPVGVVEVKLHVRGMGPDGDGAVLYSSMRTAELDIVRAATAAADAHQRVLRIRGYSLHSGPGRPRLFRASQVHVWEVSPYTAAYYSDGAVAVQEISGEELAALTQADLDADQHDLTRAGIQQARERRDAQHQAYMASLRRRDALNWVPPGYRRVDLTRPPAPLPVQARVHWDREPEPTWQDATANGWCQLDHHEHVREDLRGVDVVEVQLVDPDGHQRELLVRASDVRRT